MSKSNEMRRLIDDFKNLTIKESISNIEVPKYLYHATFKPLLKKIKDEGLGGKSARRMWTDSKKGVVYLDISPNGAFAFAEESEELTNDDWLEKIIILKIDTKNLDKNILFIDKNNDNEEEIITYEYHGVIPFDSVVEIMTEDDLY